MGKEDPNTALIGLSSARQRNAIEMAFRWCADDGPTLNAGLVAWDPDQYCKETLYFCDFKGGSGPCPPLDPPMYCVIDLLSLESNSTASGHSVSTGKFRSQTDQRLAELIQ